MACFDEGEGGYASGKGDDGRRPGRSDAVSREEVYAAAIALVSSARDISPSQNCQVRYQENNPLRAMRHQVASAPGVGGPFCRRLGDGHWRTGRHTAPCMPSWSSVEFQRGWRSGQVVRHPGETRVELQQPQTIGVMAAQLLI